jgi:beta-hydroxylase
MIVTIGLSVVTAFVLGSLAYVFAFRGKTRYAGLSEYLRKGWPVFSPFNCVLYMLTEKRAAKNYADLKDFPDLAPIRDNWKIIQKEARAVYDQEYFDKTKDKDNASHYDLGFRTFYKYGWSKFYVTWYGYTHKSSQRLMPETVKLLERIPSVNGAMLTTLPPGGKLTRHLDPLACSLRYHLGLMTPNDDNCYINVDGEPYSWRDGQAMLFDETYIHYVENKTDQPRLILMCDVERPMGIVGKIVNFFYKGLTRLTVVPNTDEDKRGFVNAVFAGLAPLIAKIKGLKQSNRPLYYLIKHTINLSALLIIILILAGAFQFIALLVD